MAYTVTTALTGVELAEHLAGVMTDLEFELLVRARIKKMFDAVHAARPNLYPTHDYCAFRYNREDKSEWTINLGETYSKKASAEGEVLTSTFADALEIMDAKDRNKLSLLLAPPEAMAAE